MNWLKYFMQLNNRIKRIKAILDLLNQGLNLSTPKLVERFGVSKKIIQTDFKEYILPLFPNETIYYDYSLKTYKAKNKFLSKTLFNSKELAIISILKNKSTDKYSDIDLKANVDELFYKFEKELSNQLYSKSSVEKIDKFKNELIQLENAIENKNIVKCFYNNKHREIYPLKILNLEEFWYLIVFEPIDNKIKTFHLNTIKNVEVLHNKYSFDKTKIDSFKNAINAYHKLDSEKISVILFANKEVSRYFLRKPLNQTQRVLKQYDDKSIDFEIVVTNLMEIIPTIQRYIPHVKVIEPLELKEAIKKNIEVLNTHFSFDEEKINSFDNAISAYYKPNNASILVQLFLDKEVSRYFLRKPLNKTQRVLKVYDDESVDLELTITDYMEIIPTIQRYIPHIGVIEPDELKNRVKENIDLYLKRFE